MTKKRLEQAVSHLESEVSMYDEYLRGNVYWFNIIDSDGEDVDSCGGYYGYDHEKSGLMDTVRDSINCDKKDKEEKKNVAMAIHLKISEYVDEMSL